MPASSAGPSVGVVSTPTTPKSKREELQLYEKCLEKDGVGAQYNADQLLKIGMEIGLFSDLGGVMTTTDWLTERNYFSLMRMHDGEACWKIRDAETAKMYGLLLSMAWLVLVSVAEGAVG